MDLTKLAPWNWFKDEEETKSKVVPVKRNNAAVSHADTILDIQRNFEDLFNVLNKNIENTFVPLKTDDIFKSDWFKPSLDIASGDDNYTVKTELPGVDSNNIEIEIDNNIMRIKGEKKQETEEKDKDFYKIERSYGSFQRVLNLPEDSNIEHIVSEYKDGVLTVTIPKKELPKSDVKKIEVKSK